MKEASVKRAEALRGRRSACTQDISCSIFCHMPLPATDKEWRVRKSV